MEYNTMNVKCVCMFWEEEDGVMWCGSSSGGDHDDCSLFSKLNSMRCDGLGRTTIQKKTMDDDGVTKQQRMDT